MNSNLCYTSQQNFYMDGSSFRASAIYAEHQTLAYPGAVQSSSHVYAGSLVYNPSAPPPSKCSHNYAGSLVYNPSAPSSQCSHGYAGSLVYNPSAPPPSQWNHGSAGHTMTEPENRFPQASEAYPEGYAFQHAYGGHNTCPSPTRARYQPYKDRRPSYDGSGSHTHTPKSKPKSKRTTHIIELPRPDLPAVSLSSIKFYGNGEPGLSLKGILSGKAQVDDPQAEVFAPFGFRQTFMAIYWPGYESTTHREVIELNDDELGRVTRKRLALKIALSLKKFMDRASCNNMVSTHKRLDQKPGYEDWSLHHELCRVRDIKLVAFHYHTRVWVPQLAVELYDQ